MTLKQFSGAGHLAVKDFSDTAYLSFGNLLKFCAKQPLS